MCREVTELLGFIFAFIVRRPPVRREVKVLAWISLWWIFSDLTLARGWTESFIYYYNNHDRHSRLNFVTPNEVHKGLHLEILAKRDKVYEQAKLANPPRWARNKIRNWSPTVGTWPLHQAISHTA